MSKHKDTKKANGEGEPEQPPKLDTSQIESTLGRIHAGVAQARATKDAPLIEVKKQLTAAVDSKREMMTKFASNWNDRANKAAQTLRTMDLPAFRIANEAIQRARNGVLLAARQLIDLVGNNHLADIEREIASLHDLRVQTALATRLMGRINALDGLEKAAQENWDSIKYHLAKLEPHAPKPVTTMRSTEDIEDAARRDPNAPRPGVVSEFDPFTHGKE